MPVVKVDKFDLPILRYVSGDTLTTTLTVKVGRTLVDLSSYAISFEATDELEDSVSYLSLTLVDAVNGNDWTNGLVVLKVEDDETPMLPEKGYFHIKATNAGDTQTLVRGQLQRYKSVYIGT